MIIARMLQLNVPIYAPVGTLVRKVTINHSLCNIGHESYASLV